ncbi:hypothetical protein QCA50_013693 [Cerrena zonata]|uniref:F-box domain-containing protein n=1 Tax=Cerrena zonata TaxID=2478898 RepID=A0AAW0FQ81_9APHY
MDSIPIIIDGFPPEVVTPGTSFSNLTPAEIHAQITSHETVVSRLEYLLLHHRRAIARYRGSLNEIVPSINRSLPPEILSEIFLRYRRVHNYGTQYIHDANRSFYPWLKAAHVCRSWRNIVLSTSLLFDTLHMPMMHTSFGGDFLRLSGKRPLYLEIHYPWWYQCTPLLHRTRSVIVHSDPSHDWVWKWPTCPTVSYFDWCPSKVLPRRLLDRDLRDVMPNLQCLKTTKSVSICDTFPRTLKTLILTGNMPPGRRVEEILLKLHELPQLENLSISSLYHDDPDLSLPPVVQEQNQLGHLKCLELKGRLPWILTFLYHIRSVDSLKLYFNHFWSRDPWSLLPPVLQTKLRPPPQYCLVPIGNSSALTCGFVQRRDGLELGINEGKGYDNTFPYNSYQVIIKVDPLQHSLPIEILTRSLSSHLASVTSSKFTFEPDPIHSNSNLWHSRIMMQTVLCTMPNTTILDITPSVIRVDLNGYFDGYFDVLLPPPKEDNTLHFPDLRKMRLDARGLVYNCYYQVPSSVNAFFTPLRDVLQCRKEHGMELQVLEMYGCDRVDDSGLVDNLTSLLGPFVGDLIFSYQDPEDPDE